MYDRISVASTGKQKYGTQNVNGQQGVTEGEVTEKWSAKYKRSINCNNPKGFSQRAHCQGRKKGNK